MIKRLLLFSCICLGLSGCEQPSPELSRMIAKPLGKDVSMHLRGIEYKVAGTRIEVGGQRLEVLPYAERCGLRGAKHLCGVRFDIRADGAKDDRLTFRVVGRGQSREAAHRDAVHHWWVGVGFPLIRSLADDHTDFGGSPYAAYPGAMVIRGKPPRGWVDGSTKMHQQLTTVLTSVVGEKPVVKSIDLKVSVDGEGGVNGECRVNGVVSQEVLRELRKISWPKGDPHSGYRFYQTYILKHVSES